MIENSMNEDVVNFIKDRLRLSQELLEESDILPGNEGYFKTKKKELMRHQRHEREALVCYLLLTCFDRLGQKQKYLTFDNWLNSKKKIYENERNVVIAKMEQDDILSCAKALYEQYQAIYGVKNSFYNGINSLPENARKKLLDSIQVRLCPEYGLNGPNVGMPASRLNDPDLKEKLQFKYLYKSRNRFTHSLEQYQRSSQPFRSNMTLFWSQAGQASWMAEIEDSKLNYHCLHHEHELISGGGAYLYYIQEWPFVLFEVLHAGIGQQFHRTSINLRFQVRLKNKNHPEHCGLLMEAKHEALRDFKSIENEYWKKYSSIKRP